MHFTTYYIHVISGILLADILSYLTLVTYEEDMVYFLISLLWYVSWFRKYGTMFEAKCICMACFFSSSIHIMNANWFIAWLHIYFILWWINLDWSQGHLNGKGVVRSQLWASVKQDQNHSSAFQTEGRNMFLWQVREVMQDLRQQVAGNPPGRDRRNQMTR
jgi:hypothetical protein